MSEGQDPEALRRSDIRWRPNDEGRWNDHKAVQARVGSDRYRTLCLQRAVASEGVGSKGLGYKFGDILSKNRPYT